MENPHGFSQIGYKLAIEYTRCCYSNFFIIPSKYSIDKSKFSECGIPPSILVMYPFLSIKIFSGYGYEPIFL